MRPHTYNPANRQPVPASIEALVDRISEEGYDWLDNVDREDIGEVVDLVKNASDDDRKKLLDAIASWYCENGGSGYDHIDDVAHGIAEPGYQNDDTSGCCFLGDWWSYTAATETDPHGGIYACLLGEIIEAADGWHAFSDEWTRCADCGKLVRTTADCYGWKRAYLDTDDGPVCKHCLTPDVVAETLKGEANKADTFDTDFSEVGYRKVDQTFANGWYGGQDDDPKAIAKALRARGIEDFIFQIDDVGQFDLHFSVWIPDDTEIDDGEVGGKADEDPATVLERGLRNASQALAALPEGSGIKVASISGDKVDARVVSTEDFIAGRALSRDGS